MEKTMTSVRDWKVGDRGKTRTGEVVTVKEIVGRYIVINENLPKQIYIPAHGELIKY